MAKIIIQPLIDENLRLKTMVDTLKKQCVMLWKENGKLKEEIRLMKK